MIGGRNRWSPWPRNGLKSHRKEGKKEGWKERIEEKGGRKNISIT
jgi:hypothetical protein